MRLYDNESYRAEFASDVYKILSSDQNNCRANQIIDWFDLAPEVDAEPVRYGRWRGLDCTHYAGTDESGEPTYKPHREYRCSLCGRATIIRENYCPDCGARMDEGEESHD